MAFVGTGILEFLTVQTVIDLDFEEKNEVIFSETLGAPAEFLAQNLHIISDHASQVLSYRPGSFSTPGPIAPASSQHGSFR